MSLVLSTCLPRGYHMNIQTNTCVCVCAEDRRCKRRGSKKMGKGGGERDKKKGNGPREQGHSACDACFGTHAENPSIANTLLFLFTLSLLFFCDLSMAYCTAFMIPRRSQQWQVPNWFEPSNLYRARNLQRRRPALVSTSGS
jgi:hypothetical protein